MLVSEAAASGGEEIASSAAALLDPAGACSHQIFRNPTLMNVTELQERESCHPSTRSVMSHHKLLLQKVIAVGAQDEPLQIVVGEV